MCSRISTCSSIGNCSQELNELKRQLALADAVVVGAGAGMSAAAGFTYSGARFEKHFSDFGAKYGFADMYSGGFYPYETPEVHWAYWSRYIMVNRYMDPPKQTYRKLLRLVQDKDYFVITTNVDHCFQKAGFDKGRLFYTQGDYGLFQCSEPCCNRTWDNEAQVREMVERQADMRIPTKLIPRCPECGRPLTMNLRADDRFVEDAGWHAAAQRYQDFINAHIDDRVLYLELGVGNNTPVIIKYPFWQLTYRNPKATYACINMGQAWAPGEIEWQSICIDGDIDAALDVLLQDEDAV